MYYMQIDKKSFDDYCKSIPLNRHFILNTFIMISEYDLLRLLYRYWDRLLPSTYINITIG